MVCACLLGLLGSSAYAANCDAIQDLKLPDTTITLAERVSSGDLEGPAWQRPCMSYRCFAGSRESCSLRRTRKFILKSGCRRRTGTAAFSVSATAGLRAPSDTGPRRQSAPRVCHLRLRRGPLRRRREDASWAFGHPEKIADFGWRAVHLTAERAKDVVKAYYGEPAGKSYFDSCSDGGREALMEAQRFPEDYDGILAGAPANAWTHLLSSGLSAARNDG